MLAHLSFCLPKCVVDGFFRFRFSPRMWFAIGTIWWYFAWNLIANMGRIRYNCGIHQSRSISCLSVEHFQTHYLDLSRSLSLILLSSHNFTTIARRHFVYAWFFIQPKNHPYPSYAQEHIYRCLVNVWMMNAYIRISKWDISCLFRLSITMVQSQKSFIGRNLFLLISIIHFEFFVLKFFSFLLINSQWILRSHSTP